MEISLQNKVEYKRAKLQGWTIKRERALKTETIKNMRVIKVTTPKSA